MSTKRLFAVLLLSLCFGLNGQELKNETMTVNQDLLMVSNRQTKVAKVGLSALVGWSASNMIVGGVMQARSTGQNQYFHRMNIYFNSVNLALGGLGLLDAYKQRSVTLKDVYERQQEIEKIYLFNTALDLSYVAVGWGLLNLSLSKTGDERFMNAGYGNSMVLQGSFLFAYDLVMLMVHKRNNPTLNSFWSKMELSQNGIGFSYQL